jgi:Ca2+-transporting ATPase
MSRGLSEAEAAARLARDGPNELPAKNRSGVGTIILEVIREPMFALLLGAAVLYAVIGDLGEAALLFGFATISVSIAIVQRGRSERVLEALRDLTSPRALVLRDGERRRIPGRDVVAGDVLILTEGDRVPADATVIEASDVRVDESLLTGESVPVHKHGEDSPTLYSGTLLVRGTAMAVVIATGARSEIGKIGRAVGAIESETPRLQAQTRRLVLIFAVAALFLSVLAVLLYGWLRGQWLEALLGGIALGMSMLPEEFPLVLTVFMVMGAWRLSRSRVLTRRATAIETLGAATVLCTDKTGTLTRNSMSVVHLEAESEVWKVGDARAHIDASSKLGELLAMAMSASEPQALDPMDRALLELAGTAPALAASGERARVYPLRRELLAVTHVWNPPDGIDFRLTAKGAPEAIMSLCRMDGAERDALKAKVDALARQGIRVLAVARGSFPRQALPESAATFHLRYLGLVGFADPLRESVPEAVRDCLAAGIRVVMITGDYPETARAIAREAGIASGYCLAGEEIERLSDEALAARVRHATVFARITPQQKLRIVNALKANGDVVAMTGDGVNDAPALKAAHIGIAMGGRGTDVAREASSLVLLDDDFASIVRAIRLGRRIYDNLRKAMGYILAVHVPIAGLALLPIVLGAPLVLTPMLIAFLELIIDPACSIVLEAEGSEKGSMRRPPRDPASALISRPLALWSLLQGVLAVCFVAAVYFYARASGLEDREVRAASFIALVGANIALVFVNRTFGASLRAALGRPNPSLWWGLSVTAVLLGVVLLWPAARDFFGLAVLPMQMLALSAGVGVVLLASLQLIKLVYGRRLLA